MRVDELIARLSSPPFRPEDEVVVGTRRGGDLRAIDDVSRKFLVGSPVILLARGVVEAEPCMHADDCMYYESL